MKVEEMEVVMIGTNPILSIRGDGFAAQIPVSSFNEFPTRKDNEMLALLDELEAKQKAGEVVDLKEVQDYARSKQSAKKANGRV